MARIQERKLAVFSISLVSFIIILQYWLLSYATSRKNTSRHAIATNVVLNREPRKIHNNEDEMKLVLFYTPLPWLGLYNLTHSKHILCAIQACKITFNKRDLARSDAVIFHGRNLPNTTHMEHIMKQKTPKQRWVYAIQESPKFTYYVRLYNGYFNWTLSYRRDSDFFVPYRTYTRLQPEEISYEQAQNRNYAKGKDRLVVWMASHCKILREDFVTKLMKYLKVDVFGRCSRRFNQTETCLRFSVACSEKLKRYKFILALENSYCTDYITEKYWYTPFEHDNVPIVLGGANYDEKIAIPGSFINVLDFSSVETLVNYLVYLDKNDTAYNEYFSWRKRFKPVLPSWPCQMCAALHNDSLPLKVYNDLDEFWGEKGSCGAHTKRIQEFIEQF